MVRAALGVEWMTLKEARQAIPPAYTEFLGGYLHLAIALRFDAASNRPLDFLPSPGVASPAVTPEFDGGPSALIA